MTSASYETDEILQQYLLFHYGAAEDQLPWDFGPREALGFPVRCVTEGVDTGKLPARNRALDIGCSVGRSTFELGRIFGEVTGIDYSFAFITAARMVYREGSVPFQIRETGLIRREVVARRPENVAGRLSFEQGDAQRLRQDLGTFDCLLAANLLCRLSRPVDFLARLPALLNPGGQLILTTPNTWLESFTAREFWIGATPDTGEPLEALENELKPHFRLEATWEMPFLIREHRRKYQWSVAQASRWIRLS
ncbi:MAG: putative 4-mercaptohistidine N1-methyltransferase [Oceanipulchritudo sp.]|jgi:putative 4-mercaptohistidine N1-methyltranferase